MGWLIALGILVLIAMIPVGASVFYDDAGPRAFVVIGPLRICVFPVKKREKKEKPPKKKREKPAQQTSVKKQNTQKSKGGSIDDFLPLLDRLLDFLSAFRRKLRVPHLEVKLILAGDDPSDLAMNYGRGWALLGNLMPLLDGAFVIKKRNLEVECDFLANQTTVSARLDISITIGRVITLLVIQGVPILREFLKIMNKRKGGAKA